MLPTFGLIVAVGALAVSLPQIGADRKAHRVALARAETVPLLRRSLELHRFVAQEYVATWHATLGHDSVPTSERRELRIELERFQKSLPAAASANTKSNVDRAFELVASLGSSSDQKATLGLLGRLAEVTTDIGDDLSRPAGPEMERVASLFQGIDTVVALDNATTIARVANGVDAMPARPDLRDYIQGIAAGTGDPDPEIATLSDALVDVVARGHGLRPVLTDIASSEAVRAMNLETAWMLGGAPPSNEHPTFDDYSLSARRTLDAVSAAIDADLETTQRAFATEATEANRRRNVHTLLSAGSAVLAVLAVAALIARVRTMLRTLREASENDPVTSLLNRTGLRARVAPWFANRAGGPVAVAVVDLDHFKSVNDTFGHVTGDGLLREAARRMSGEVVASSTALARWGGDEFVMVFRLTTEDTEAAVAAVCGRVRKAISLPFDHSGTQVAVTASTGASICACGRCDVDELFRSADQLLLATKRQGRDAIAVGECGRVSSPLLRETPRR